MIFRLCRETKDDCADRKQMKEDEGMKEHVRKKKLLQIVLSICFVVTALGTVKTNAAKRSIPLPPRLLEALKEAKESSTSDYVIANKDGQPLTYTQFKRLWTYITTRTAKPRKAKKLVGGKYVKYTIYPVLGEKARNNGKVVYSLDFEVTPHQLRHTYITNLIYASVDPKTVQYLAGHENSKITMDIYAKAKYNRPKDVAPMLEHVFNQWNGMTTK